MNYLSSTNELSEIVTQEIFFSEGNVRTCKDILTKEIFQKGKYTNMVDTKGRKLKVRTPNVDFIRITGKKPFEIKEEWKSNIENYIIHFSNGRKEAINEILTDSLKEGEFSKYFLLDGSYIMINDDNVDVIEILPKGVVAEENNFKVTIMEDVTFSWDAVKEEWIKKLKI